MTTPITIQQGEPGQPIEVNVTSVGYRGPQGDVGPANTLTVGTVTTGEAGSSASATITGAAPLQTLNLTIPRGDVGEAGPAGEAGPQGEAGPAAGLPTIKEVTDNYTLEEGDGGCVLWVFDNASSRTITVPAVADLEFPIGTAVQIVNDDDGTLVVEGAATVTVNGTPSLELRTRFSHATLLHLSTNYWLLYGDLADPGS